jgi:hypothetical protein
VYDAALTMEAHVTSLLCSSFQLRKSLTIIEKWSLENGTMWDWPKRVAQPLNASSLFLNQRTLLNTQLTIPPAIVDTELRDNNGAR